jgi:LPXTG-site transpeptidase (sortase) family protein
MRDFSLLAVSFTSLVLGALILLHSGRTPAALPLAVIEEERFPDEAPTPVPTPQPTPEPPPPPSEAPVARLRIGSIGVDAPIVYLGVDPDGVMQSPKTAYEVGWYDFSAHPSFDGNAVFAGHVDLASVGAAVFWRLRQVAEGDDIEVSLEDGTTYAYKVVSTNSYASGDAPVEEIIGPTERDSITLITCDGTFNTRTREYDKRLIVRAEKVLPDGPAAN